jgi:ribonuclease HI
MTGVVSVYPGSACEKQPGRGAWATVLSCNGRKKELVGRAQVTTNNRMVLIAVIKGLNSLVGQRAVQVITNSQYVQKGGKEWISNWMQDGRLDNGGVENAELWKEIYRLSNIHFVEWIWQKSDADPHALLVCKLAKQALNKE